MKAMKRLALASVAGVATLAAGSAWAQLDQAVATGERSTRDGAAVQRQIDDLADQRDDLFRQYSAVEQQVVAQETYVGQQRLFSESQRNELDDLRGQIERVESVLQNLQPMKWRMIDELEQFIGSDIPFRINDRRASIDILRDFMADPNVTDAERYRAILTAYQNEVAYGQSTQYYEGSLVNGDGLPINFAGETVAADAAPTVDFVSVGRIAFYFLSRDEQTMGIWNNATRSWDMLDAKYRPDLRQALRQAKNAASPAIMTVPIFVNNAGGSQ